MGTVTDQYGRNIQIDEDGLRSLYKEPGSGKHIVESENYEECRGKRLPWIRHVLQYSRSVYLSEATVNGKFRRSYIYTAVASIPVKSGFVGSYFVIVVLEDGNKRLRFLTAYAISSLNSFLKRIEPGRPIGES